MSTVQLSEAAKSQNLKDFIAKLDYQVFFTADGSVIPVKGALSNPKEACKHLEHGGVIFFPQTPFEISASDRQFLLQQKQSDANSYKNMAYRPLENRVTGYKDNNPENVQELTRILGDFSSQVTDFLSVFLEPYAKNWRMDFASFRPIEEKGRKARTRARNDLLHVDSFPTRPTHGDRIFRCFVNINPSQPRIWRTSDPFSVLASNFKDHVPPPHKFKPSALSNIDALKKIGKALGFKAIGKPAYDSWMLNFHNFLKENEHFQENSRKDIWELPANSAWMVMTDVVSHSVLSGQFALEQTYLVSRHDMVAPETTPINVLKKLYGAESVLA